MMAVKEKCIARQQAPHEGGNGSFAGANQKMHVIGHQSPGKARGRSFGKDFFKTLQEIIVVNSIFKDLFFALPSNNNVVQSVGSVNSSLALHALLYSKLSQQCQFIA
jgi:hypothetical protein